MTPSVLVIGSINQDITVRVERFPQPGETLIGLEVAYGLGGKGANQAVAAARTGVATSLVATVGDDPVGVQLRGWLDGLGVDTSLLAVAPGSSGTAHIAVDAGGENQIVVVPGANAATDALRVRASAGAIAEADIVVLQGEIPAAAVAVAVASAREARTPVLLNLAPVLSLPSSVLSSVNWLVVNETEAGLLLNKPAPASVDEALSAAADLRVNAVITLGARGAVWTDNAGGAGHFAAPAVTAIDTTGAGDAFVGVMAAALASGLSPAEAVERSIQAAALSVQRRGAAMSYPAFDLD